MEGVLIIHKEKHMTSHDVVGKLRRLLKTKRIGHAGTLDPLATGVLVIGVGRATKLLQFLMADKKVYRASLKLGFATTTYDLEGEVTASKEYQNDVSLNQVNEVLSSFLGDSMQIPPIYSAIKKDGKALYEYAREGKEVELPTKDVYINNIELISFEDNKFTFKCNVSKGTYIRSLINDICDKLNVLGTMSNLKRTKQGKFSIEDSIDLDDIEENKIIPMEKVIELPIIEVDEYLFNRIKHGNKLQNRYNLPKFAFFYNNKLIAIYIPDPNDSKVIKPKTVFI